MSEQEQPNNICSVCGGVLRIEYVFALEQSRPHDLRVQGVPDGFFRLCPGHYPEQDKMHDGKLEAMGGERYSASVEFFDDHPATALLKISDGYAVGHTPEDMAVYLDPKQALSLLTWLLQERPRLEELAKEQEAHG